MAHHRLTKNVHEDMVSLDGYYKFSSDSLPLDLYELKAIEDANKQGSSQFKTSEKTYFTKLGDADERAKLLNKYNFFLNTDFVSEILDVDPLLIKPVENDWQDE